MSTLQGLRFGSNLQIGMSKSVALRNIHKKGMDVVCFYCVMISMFIFKHGNQSSKTKNDGL